MPVDLDLETVTMGFVFKSGFVLPMNVSDFSAIFSDPFDPTTHPITNFFKRSVDEIDDSVIGFDSEQNEKYERHLAEAEVVESSTENEEDFSNVASSDEANNFDTIRWLVYQGLAEVADK